MCIQLLMEQEIIRLGVDFRIGFSYDHVFEPPNLKCPENLGMVLLKTLNWEQIREYKLLVINYIVPDRVELKLKLLDHLGLLNEGAGHTEDMGNAQTCAK
ncbi:MAG: hypothetical protein WA951_12505 [Leeuwenhoekiella sp.]